MKKKIAVFVLVLVGILGTLMVPANASPKSKSTSGWYITSGTESKGKRGGKKTYYRYYCKKCKKYGKKCALYDDAVMSYRLHSVWH